MNKSESTKAISSALCKFQGEVKNPPKTADNPFFKSKYTPLDVIIDTIKPVLHKNGLSFIQSCGGDGSNISVVTLILHESGEWIESEPLVLKADKPTAQGAGSAITYARRYALATVLGIASDEDDDGNGAEPTPNPKKKADKPEPKQEPKKPEPKQPKSDKPTVQQLKDLMILAQDKNVSLKEFGQKVTGKKSSTEWTIEDYNKVCKELEAIQ